MTDYYLDSSTIVKRYVDEVGSEWVRSITAEEAEGSVILAEITLAEVAAAFATKHRIPGGITEDQRDRALSLFLEDCDKRFLLVPVDRPVIDRAVELTQSHGLRGYDAVQLATALVTSEVLQSQALPALTFVAADSDLVAAARSEQLPVSNPLEQR